MTRKFAFALSLGVALAASPALAVDAFVVNIPVSFTGLDPTISSVAINCKVMAVDGGGTTIASFHVTKTVNLPIKGGYYTGPATVNVKFTLNDFDSVEQAKVNLINQASCNAQLVGPAGPSTPHSSQAKPGTAFNVVGTGRF